MRFLSLCAASGFYIQPLGAGVRQRPAAMEPGSLAGRELPGPRPLPPPSRGWVQWPFLGLALATIAHGSARRRGEPLSLRMNRKDFLRTLAVLPALARPAHAGYVDGPAPQLYSLLRPSQGAGLKLIDFKI